MESRRPDLANRSSIARIRKHHGFRFKDYDEGKLIDHVRARQAFYLGAVFAVIREWVREGRQSTDDTRHDLREWAGKLDWICQNIFRAAPLMDGHEQAQERVSNPSMTWLRQVALAVVKTDRASEEWSASQLFDCAKRSRSPFPGFGKWRRKKAGR